MYSCPDGALHKSRWSRHHDHHEGCPLKPCGELAPGKFSACSDNQNKCLPEDDPRKNTLLAQRVSDLSKTLTVLQLSNHTSVTLNI